jgi:predicted GNAT family acetyltransferase
VTFIDASSRDVLARHFPHTHAHLDALAPCAAHVIDGHAVAICRAVRRSRIALEAGVDTIEAFRGRGFGAAVVAAWAERVWQDGRVPCYATDFSNAASLALARRLDMMRIGTEATIE